jgi:hypothetical protein
MNLSRFVCFFIVILFLLSACVASANNQQAVVNSFTSTDLKVTPVATIDYRSTLVSVERLQTSATAAQDQRIHEINMEYARQTSLVLEQQLNQQKATLTAVSTIVPITQTAEYMRYILASGQQTAISSVLTATAEFPELEQRLYTIKTGQYFDTINAITILLIGISFFLISISLFFKWSTAFLQEKRLSENALNNSVDWGPKPQNESETVITIQHNGIIRKDVLPITNEMMVEYAERIFKGESPAINNFEGSETLWTRDSYMALRNWMLRVSFARVINGRGEIELTEEGKRFFLLIKQTGETPPLYYFSDDIQKSTGNSSHDTNLMINTVGEEG